MKVIICLFLLVSVLSQSNAWSTTPPSETGTMKPYCPDAKVLSGNLISKVPWNTIFPLRIAGVSVGGGGDVPDGAADGTALCICTDNNGVPHVGTQVSFYEPARIAEVVRVPGCSPTLGGAMLESNPLQIGGGGTEDRDASDKGFYHVNYYAFPLLVMLDLFTNINCKGNDGYMDLDLIHPSLADPTWEDDELAIFYSPEALLFTLPGVRELCSLIDGPAATAGISLDKFYYCAGTWGEMYPFTGNFITNASPPRDSSLISTRMMARLHRIGLARKTMGDDVMCKSKIFTTLPKSQYRLSMFYPVAEVEGLFNSEDASGAVQSRRLKGSHVIGESTFTWGEWRNRPGTGEDFVYMIWRWLDCCGTKAKSE